MTDQTIKVTDERQPSDKKAYHTPKFNTYGNIAELTQTSSPPPFSGNDGGSFPNNYAS